MGLGDTVSGDGDRYPTGTLQWKDGGEAAGTLRLWFRTRCAVIIFRAHWNGWLRHIAPL